MNVLKENQLLKKIKIRKQKNQIKRRDTNYWKKKNQQQRKISSSLINANMTILNFDIFVKTKNKQQNLASLQKIEKFTRCVQGTK